MTHAQGVDISATDGATTAKGRSRARHILDTAVDVFLDQGYANFTVRAVAEAAGMSIGNLNYYYPRKNDLLQAMTEYLIDGYLAQFERARDEAGDDPAAQLERVIDFWIDDLATARTTRFFPELWALANHDAQAAVSMDYVYERARRVLLRIVRELHPHLDAAQADRVTVVMCAAMEGLTLFIGRDKPWARERENIKAICKRLLVDAAG